MTTIEDDMGYESEPVCEWEYRNITCVLYCLRIPDDSRWVGYAQVGDVWTDVLDDNGSDPTGDPESMKERVENEVDRLIRRALNENSIFDEIDDGGQPDPLPIDPNPAPPNPDVDPPPNPRPFPYDPDPLWEDDDVDPKWRI